MVCASCFSLSFDGVIPTASRIDVSTVVGAATVEPSEFDKMTYKFCIPTRKPNQNQVGEISIFEILPALRTCKCILCKEFLNLKIIRKTASLFCMLYVIPFAYRVQP